MLPLGFNDLADSPTIVSSPHQHQFDPITSRAAHSIYYHHQPRKPLMPTRHWDHPVAMSKAVPMTGNPAKKRAHDDHDEDEPLATSYLPPKTPTVSPTNATQGAGMASIQQLGNDRMDLETQMHGKFTEAPTAKLPDTTKSDSHVKRARLLPNNTTLTGPTNAASLSSPAEGAKDSELTCRGSDHSCMGLPSSTSTGWTAELRRLDGNGGGEPHSPPSDPSSGETTTSSSSDPHQASDSNDAFNPAENMEID